MLKVYYINKYNTLTKESTNIIDFVAIKIASLHIKVRFSRGKLIPFKVEQFGLTK